MSCIQSHLLSGRPSHVRRRLGWRLQSAPPHPLLPEGLAECGSCLHHPPPWKMSRETAALAVLQEAVEGSHCSGRPPSHSGERLPRGTFFYLLSPADYCSQCWWSVVGRCHRTLVGSILWTDGFFNKRRVRRGGVGVAGWGVAGGGWKESCLRRGDFRRPLNVYGFSGQNCHWNGRGCPFVDLCHEIKLVPLKLIRSASAISF